MRYALDVNTVGGTKRVIVYFALPQARMCAIKVREYNPVPFAKQDTDSVVREMLDTADKLIRENVVNLFLTTNRVYSCGTGGYVVQVYHPADRLEQDDDLIEVEFLIDPVILWHDEAMKNGLYGLTRYSEEQIEPRPS